MVLLVLLLLLGGAPVAAMAMCAPGDCPVAAGLPPPPLPLPPVPRAGARRAPVTPPPAPVRRAAELRRERARSAMPFIHSTAGSHAPDKSGN